MRLIHTADWHLGKSLKSQPLLDDQKYILQEFLKAVDDAKPDAVIIAGDVYDRSIPPVDAVNLFDEIIFKLVERKVPVLCISGNHDSAARLNFGSRLFERLNFFISTRPSNNPQPVVLSDDFGEVYFSLIPYFDAVEIKETFAPQNGRRAGKDSANAVEKIFVTQKSFALESPENSSSQASLKEKNFVLRTLLNPPTTLFQSVAQNSPENGWGAGIDSMYEVQKQAPRSIPNAENLVAQDSVVNNNTANKIYLSAARKNIPAGKRSVAVAHIFATGGKTSDSERKSVGAVENVDAENFSGYNYTALGHLHSPQKISATVRYSGSLLKYSFDEANQRKGVTLVELAGDGKISVEQIDLKPRRDVRIVKGTVSELLKSARSEDYVHAELLDKNHVLYAMDKLRDGAFPNILSVRFANLEREVDDYVRAAELREGITPLEHFADFYKQVTDEDLIGDEREAMENFMLKLKREVNQ